MNGTLEYGEYSGPNNVYSNRKPYVEVAPIGGVVVAAEAASAAAAARKHAATAGPTIYPYKCMIACNCALTVAVIVILCALYADMVAKFKLCERA